MPRSLQICAAILLLLVGAAVTVLVQKASGLSPQPAEEMTYAEFTSVILSALGVIIAALTLFLGAAALIGWTAFESLVQRNTSEYLNRRFGTEDVRSQDSKEIEEIVRREIALQKTQEAEQPENESPFGEEVL